MKDCVRAKVRFAWKAWKDREDPGRPEEFTRDEIAKDELRAVFEILRWKLICYIGENPERGLPLEDAVRENVRWDEPFPLKGWECVSFPMAGPVIWENNGKPVNKLPPAKRLSGFCAEGRRWLGIEIELPGQPRHAEAYAPDGSILFQEDYAETPPSFYAAVEEYWPVYAIKMAAKGLELN